MCEMCDGKSVEQVRRALLARIARNDYTMVSVREERDRDRTWRAPGFVYSIGLWTFHRVPELIIVGAPARQAVGLIERYAQLAKAGTRLVPGGPCTELGPGAYRLELVAKSRYLQWFRSAYDFYPDGEFAAYQLIWADRRGHWPWQHAWTKHNNPPQPILTASGRLESHTHPSRLRH
jgi:hypothetical protein